MSSTLYSSNSYEQSSNKVKATIHGGNLSTRYDRVCPLVRKGRKCQQHEAYRKWANAKEVNHPSVTQQLLQQSAAMVMMTYREDTIQKQDCPFLHPKPGVPHKQATKAVTNKNAALIEGMVDYLYAAQKIDEEEQEQEQQEQEKEQQQQHETTTPAPTSIVTKLERDPSSAIMGNQIVEKLFDSLPAETRQLWKKPELNFTHVDFCTCFCSAVAVMMQINDESSKTSSTSSTTTTSTIRSIYLQENNINTDGMQNLLRAMKTCKVGNNNNTKDLSEQQQQQQYLAPRLVLLDLSNNKIDNLTKCLFELKAYYPNLLSLFIRENPITRRPDYSELVRRTVPQIVMLDGMNLRKPPLKMPFPRVSGGIEIDDECEGNKQMQCMQRGARNFIAAYLKSLEGLSEELHMTREEFYKDDEELRDQVWHPGITVSVSFVPSNVNLFKLPDDITTEEEFLARAKALAKRGGQVGAMSREKAQNIVLEKKLKERRQREEEEEPKIDQHHQSSKKNTNNDKNKKNQEEELAPVPVLNRNDHRFITKLDAKLLRGLPVAAARNCRNISDGKNSLERIARGRLEVVDLLFQSIYLEGLSVSHHTSSASVCTVSPICMPSLWKKVKEEEKQRKIQEKLKGLGVMSKKEVKMKKNNKKNSNEDNNNIEQQQEDAAFGGGILQSQQPKLFMVTVHGTMSWRTPSLTGQSTIRVAADHTFVVVATETEEFFREREEADQKKFEKFLKKQHDRMTKGKQRNKQNKNDDEDDDSNSDSSSESDEDGVDASYKTPQEVHRDEILKYLKGFRICNQAVMIRDLNPEEENKQEGAAVNNNNNDAERNHVSSSSPFVFYSSFLFNPLRQQRLQRLAHIYGTTPAAVAKIMERCSSDAECEEVLSKCV